MAAYPRRGMRNAEVALHFDELADLYELDGAISYRVLAYRNAAKAIREANASVEELTRAGRATELAGIGKTIAEKLAVLFETGEIPAAPRRRSGCGSCPASAPRPRRACWSRSTRGSTTGPSRDSSSRARWRSP